MTVAASAEAIVKRFGATTALDHVDLQVAEGTVQGLLGPNGAGKTTLVRTLATLLKPDSGRAEVFGHDVVRDATVVRGMIGLTGQFAAVDEILTGRENLEMFARLFRLSRKGAAARAAELLERFDLADAADRPAKTYSGGMRRRLDLASSMLVSPRLLFLDEPTTGLDPRSRTQIWEVLRELVREGTTVLLTTQYLDEADQLADRIAVIDHGRLIAEGTGDELKERVGGQMIEVEIARPEQREAACRALAELGCGDPEPLDSPNRLTVPAPEGGAAVLAQAAAALYDSSVQISDIALRRPTLDDVFLQFTGTHAEPSGGDEGETAAEAEVERV
ncbi:MAG: ATP-binding cassette domain-containing protein [Thermoleophilaceae bacterium]|nr:ATP-binding cassette domain-containing protein [Thermoleophilaceae bacterium]